MDGNSVGDDRLMRAIQSGQPVPGTPEQAAELRNQNLARAIDTAFVPVVKAAKSLQAIRNGIAEDRNTERLDAVKWAGPRELPGDPVFDGVANRMTNEARAKLWTREELMGMYPDDAHDDKLGALLLAIGNALIDGELPDYVDDDSRRGCCGVTFKTHVDESGTCYVCALCGKEQE